MIGPGAERILAFVRPGGIVGELSISTAIALGVGLNPVRFRN
jgi:hypothetical protein